MRGIGGGTSRAFVQSPCPLSLAQAHATAKSFWTDGECKLSRIPHHGGKHESPVFWIAILSIMTCICHLRGQSFCDSWSYQFCNHVQEEDGEIMAKPLTEEAAKSVKVQSYVHSDRCNFNRVGRIGHCDKKCHLNIQCRMLSLCRDRERNDYFKSSNVHFHGDAVAMLRDSTSDWDERFDQA